MFVFMYVLFCLKSIINLQYGTVEHDCVYLGTQANFAGLTCKFDLRMLQTYGHNWVGEGKEGGMYTEVTQRYCCM